LATINLMLSQAAEAVVFLSDPATSLDIVAREILSALESLS
jgi:hypothetical protein